ncbi:hypothetical protein HZB60_04010 [candidate division KSB1 bacterium]|nr:hypothetical protein [candidate division KSB1 bacterium]
MSAKSKFLLAALVTVFLPLTAWGGEKTVEGHVVGYNCAVSNIACPVDMEDPVIANERIFVVSMEEKQWVFVPNVDRAVLARHITEMVRVTGEMSEKYNAIHAKTIEVKKGDTWKTVWSTAWEAEFRAKFNVPLGK